MEGTLIPVFSDGDIIADRYPLSDLSETYFPTQSNLLSQNVSTPSSGWESLWQHDTLDATWNDATPLSLHVGTETDATLGIESAAFSGGHPGTLQHEAIGNNDPVYQQQQWGDDENSLWLHNNLDSLDIDQIVGFDLDLLDTEILDIEIGSMYLDVGHTYPNQFTTMSGLDQDLSTTGSISSYQKDPTRPAPTSSSSNPFFSRSGTDVVSHTNKSASDRSETCSNPTQTLVQRSRRLKHSRQEWLDIQPIFKQLYIDQDRNLSDVVKILSQEHNFTASEHMFKKRISVWGLAKYRKAQKEIRPSRTENYSCPPMVMVSSPHTAALNIHGILTPPTSPESSDRTLNIAKVSSCCVFRQLVDSSSYGGMFAGYGPPMVTNSDADWSSHQESCTGCQRRLTAADHELSRLLDDPSNVGFAWMGPMGDSESYTMLDPANPLEHAHSIFVSITERSYRLSRDDLASIDTLLETARIYFRLDMVSKCMETIRDLFRKFHTRLMSSPGNMVYLLQNLTYDLWGTSKIPDKIFSILCQLAGRSDKDHYRMARVMRFFSRIAGDIEAQGVMWQSLMKYYREVAIEDDILWQRLRLTNTRCFRRSHRFIDAWRACEEATAELDGIHSHNPEDKAAFAFEHAQALSAAGNLTSAIAKYRQAYDFATNSDNPIPRAKALMQIAQLYTVQDNCQPQARWHFVQAFNISKTIPGPHDAYRLLAFRMLVDFHTISGIPLVDLLLQKDSRQHQDRPQVRDRSSRKTAHKGESPSNNSSSRTLGNSCKRTRSRYRTGSGGGPPSQSSDEVFEITRDVFQRESSRRSPKQTGLGG